MPDRALERRRVDRTVDSPVSTDVVERHVLVHHLVEPDLPLRAGEGIDRARRFALGHRGMAIVKWTRGCQAVTATTAMTQPHALPKKFGTRTPRPSAAH